jgi:ADP-glucose pyrophosphorylase
MGRGWGIRIENSQNITFKDSVVFQATQIGVNLKAAKSISAENVNIIGVKKR